MIKSLVEIPRFLMQGFRNEGQLFALLDTLCSDNAKQ
jgi:hypothetical protein